MVDLLVSGRRPEDFCAVTEVTWSERWGAEACGPFEATWRLGLPPSVSVPWLARGAMVLVKDGGETVFGGQMREPVKTTAGWECSALGWARLAENFFALDGDGDAATNVLVAVQNAVTAGWPVTFDPLNIPNVSVSAQDTQQLNTVYDLLQAHVAATGERWHVDARARLRIVSDPTTPTWAVSPEVLLPATADEEWYSVIHLRYADSATTPATPKVVTRTNEAALARWGYRAKKVDKTGLGPRSATQAGVLAQSLADQAGARMGWDSPFTVTPLTLSTITDSPARLLMVRAGDMARGTGQADVQGATVPKPSVDLIVGEVKHTPGARELTINPVGRTGRGFLKMLEDVTATEEQFANNFKEEAVTG